MPDEFLDQPVIEDVLQRYIDKGDERTGPGFSRMELIEEAVDIISNRYDAIFDGDTSRGNDSLSVRGSDYNLIEAFAESEGSNEKSSLVEERIRQSDYLALHYAIVGGGIDHLLDAYVEQLSPDERASLEKDFSGFMKVGSELAEEFIVRQRKKSKESELTTKYPDAPTTGFEFEYTDALRAIIDSLERLPQEIKILEAVKANDPQLLDKVAKDKRDAEFLRDFMGQSASYLVENDDINFAGYMDVSISVKKNILTELQDAVKIPFEVSEGSKPETRFRNALKGAARQNIKRTEAILDDLGLGDEALAIVREKFQRQLDLVDGKIDFEATEDLETEDLRTMKLLVPSRAERLAQFGPLTTKAELYALEETITKPSVSVRMQLRDFIYAAKMGAFSERLSVHQNIGGLELSPDDTDFMEVTALLDAADWNGPKEDLSEKILQLIESGSHVYSDPFKKISKCADGKDYYFPYHKNKAATNSENYPTTKRALLEMRAKRAFNVKDSFTTHVRASTFTWLAAWGKQASNTLESERDQYQVQLANAWENLQTGWSKVLANKDIYQPSGDERYQEVIEHQGKLEYVGEEQYSVYLEQIVAKNAREKANGQIQRKDSLRSQSRKLIREYNKKVKEIIGY